MSLSVYSLEFEGGKYFYLFRGVNIGNLFDDRIVDSFSAEHGVPSDTVRGKGKITCVGNLEDEDLFDAFTRRSLRDSPVQLRLLSSE